jgi:predicted kinase
VSPRLVVVYGDANTGKLAKAWQVAAADPAMRFLHRDQVRVLFGRLITEPQLTVMLYAMAKTLLSQGHSVVTAGQNLHQIDRDMWIRCGMETGAAVTFVEGLK